MTYNERIESILKELKLDFISYDNIHGDNEHGCRVIESALKKQVPMKPVVRITKEDFWEYAEGDPKMLFIVKKRYPERYIEYKHYYCPECDSSVEDCGLKDDYCSGCGQKVDWSEVE